MNSEKNPLKIKKLFDEISPYYDKINSFISLGFNLAVKITSIRNLKIQPKSKILDICCGTGDLTQIIRKIQPDTQVIGVDFSPSMLNAARKKNPRYSFIEGNCTNLPFDDNKFDYVTTSYGLRNIENRKQAIKEVYRVLQPKGKFLILDFAGGEKSFGGKIFALIVPIIVKIAGGKTDNYKYLINSIKTYPTPKELTKEFEKAGFKLIKLKNFMFGAINLQIVEKI